MSITLAYDHMTSHDAMSFSNKINTVIYRIFNINIFDVLHLCWHSVDCENAYGLMFTLQSQYGETAKKSFPQNLIKDGKRFNWA